MCLFKGLSVFFVLAVFVSSGSAASLDDRKTTKSVLEDCENDLSWTCIKLEFVKFVERLTEQREFRILPGLTLVRDTNATDKTSTEIISDIARSFPNDPDKRLNGFILAKLTNLLQSHYMRVNLLDPTSLEEARAGKYKYGKKGGMEGMYAAMIMMKGTLMALGMGGIALMAGKALMTALMALTLAAAIGLKALVSGGGKSTTYEIVAKPVYTSSHSHSVSHEDGHGHGGHYSGGSGYGGGYGRSLNFELPQHLKGPE